jgi:hypothetical protein
LQPAGRNSLSAHVTNTDRRAKAVAIVSPDPMLAALVGVAIELIGYRAAFPRVTESAEDALRRIRPSFVLIDCEDARSGDETFLGRAMMTGARLFVFGPAAAAAHSPELASRYAMRTIVFPRDVEALHAILSRRKSPREQPAGSLE